MKSNQKATTKMIWSYRHYYHWPKIDIKESSQPRKIKLSKKRTFAHAHFTHIFGMQQKMLKLDKKSLSISNHRSLKAALSNCRALRNANRRKLNYDIEIYWKMMMMAMVMAKKRKTLVCYLTGVGWLAAVCRYMRWITLLSHWNGKQSSSQQQHHFVKSQILP